MKPQRWEKDQAEQRMALRSRVILGFSQGKPLSQVSQELRLNKEACQKWRRRFQKLGAGAARDRIPSSMIPSTLLRAPHLRRHRGGIRHLD
ncbi:MAG: hypothetical protein NTV33_09925 [Coprothermobacterota bacterium]|nr:hypothetical protein [Coprothermobacterota bacterium]